MGFDTGHKLNTSYLFPCQVFVSSVRDVLIKAASEYEAGEQAACLREDVKTCQ